MPTADAATMEDWIQEVFRLNEEYYALIEAGAEQELGPPAPEDKIRRLETLLGRELPPSYRLFLSLHDGWRDWEGDQDILSVDDHEQGPYRELIERFRRSAWEEGWPAVLDGIIIAACLTSNSLLILDTSKIDERGEMEIVNWELQEIARYSDFLDMLQRTAVNLQQIIEDEKSGRANEPPEEE